MISVETQQDSFDVTAAAEALINDAQLLLQAEAIGREAAATPEADENAKPDHRPQTEAELAEYEAAYSVNKGFVYGVALKFTRNHETAEEIAQDVFVSAFRSWNTYKEMGSNRRAWLGRMAYNASVNHYRKDQRGPILTHGENLTETSGSSSSSLFDRAVASSQGAEAEVLENDHQILREVMGTMSMPARRNIVGKSFLLDMPYAEIADSEDVPIGTVMSNIYRGRRQLKETLLAATGLTEDEAATPDGRAKLYEFLQTGEIEIE